MPVIAVTPTTVAARTPATPVAQAATRVSATAVLSTGAAGAPAIRGKTVTVPATAADYSKNRGTKQ